MEEQLATVEGRDDDDTSLLRERLLLLFCGCCFPDGDGGATTGVLLRSEPPAKYPYCRQSFVKQRESVSLLADTKK